MMELRAHSAAPGNVFFIFFPFVDVWLSRVIARPSLAMALELEAVIGFSGAYRSKQIAPAPARTAWASLVRLRKQQPLFSVLRAQARSSAGCSGTRMGRTSCTRWVRPSL